MDTSVSVRKTNKQSKESEPTDQLTDKSDSDRPEVLHARYRYLELNFMVAYIVFILYVRKDRDSCNPATVFGSQVKRMIQYCIR